MGLSDPEAARAAFAVPWKYAYNLVAAAMCVIAVPVMLAIAMPWGRRVPRGLIGGLAWIGTGLLVLRAGASVIQAMWIIATGRSVRLGIWEPWFYLGATLFAIAMWHYRRAAGNPSKRAPATGGAMSRLEAVLLETRALLARPGNNFSWSSWKDQPAALAELDELIAEVRRGCRPEALGVLFLPTGPIQEVSLSSGWGQEFLDVADRYDKASREP